MLNGSGADRRARSKPKKWRIIMPKSDTITAIMELNPTAHPGFLAEFCNDDLHDYLHRLIEVAEPREAATRSNIDPPPSARKTEFRRAS